MRTRLLLEADFKSTMCTRMQDVTSTATEVLDIWPYVEAIPAAELEGHVIYDRLVEFVYRSEDGHFDHVAIMTSTKNVYLVVVVDLVEVSVHGHRLLDLNKEYGLTG